MTAYALNGQPLSTVFGKEHAREVLDAVAKKLVRVYGSLHTNIGIFY
jgi:hypothetical protein